MAVVTILAAVEPGGYISILKVVPVVLVLLLWTKLLTWADKDAPAAHLPREPINIGLLGGLIGAFALFFLLPVGFLLAFPILLLVMMIEAGAYLAVRHKHVGLGDLKGQFQDWLKNLTKREKKEVVLPNMVTLQGKSGSITPPKQDDPGRAAFDAMQAALSEPLMKGSDQIDVAPSGDGIGVKYYVDGFPYKGATIDRESGAASIALVKGAAGLEVDQKRKPQRGSVKAIIGGRRLELRVDTAGSTAGEYMRLLADFKNRHAFPIDKIGLSDVQLGSVRELVKDKTGLVIISTPKGQGLTSLMYAVIRAHDAFLEHIHTIERAPEVDLEGITQNKLASNATPAEEHKNAAWVISQDPDVIMITKVEGTQTARDLIAFAREKRVYVGMNAASTFDAINAWRKLVGDDRTASSELKYVINGRVLRKLCMACKVGYTPDPATLRKLNLDPNRVKELFQARTEPLRDPKGHPIPCEFCHDLHFKGRIGVFETFVVDEEGRGAIANGAQPGPMKAAFRKQKGRYLTEEALGIVERGDTSVQEMLRVLKGADEGSASAEPGGGAERGGSPVPGSPPKPGAAPSRTAPQQQASQQRRPQARPSPKG
jgi:type II secretory ATPase GspE/PulE/Tfp pilus assembly ATPase PilB-like protein